MSRHALRWGLRLAGLALVGFFLATQVHWGDRVTLRDGSVVRGRATPTSDGGFLVADAAEPGRVHRVGPEDLAVRQAGETEVAAVSWGLRSLGLRLTARPLLALEVLLLLLATYVLTAWRWHGLLRAVDLHLPLERVVRLNFIGAFFNLVVPGSTGGDVVKAWYTARATGRGVRAVLAVFADRLIGLVGLALFAAGALLLARADPALGPARTVVFVALIVLVGGSAVLLSTRLRRWLGLRRLVERLPLHGLVAEGGAALRLYRERPGAVAGALAISLGNHAVAGVAVWLLARALQIPGVELTTALALVPVANLFGAIPLLPGGWGVGELAFAWLFGRVGVPPTEAVGLSVVYRLGMLVASLPGGLLWLFWRERPSRALAAAEVHAAEAAVATLEPSPEGPAA